MPVCGAPRTRKRAGQSDTCQREVPIAGQRCPQHSEETLRRKEEERLEKELASTGQQEEAISEIDASSMEELSRKLSPQLDMMRRLERVLRDPDDSEGEDIYLSIGRNNIIRLQMRVESDPQNIAAVIAVGNAIGQLKVNEKRQTEIEIRRLELIRLRREIQTIQSSSADVLSYMHWVNQGIADGFFTGGDPSPRRSVDAYAEWLGEDITVEQVLAGEEEYATAPWDMQREILIALFWPDQPPVEKPDCNHVICVTGNNTGKSYISARCVLFNTYFLYPSITIVTGPRLSQVRDTVSAEVRRKHSEMDLPGKANVLRLQPNLDYDRAYCNFTSAQSDEAFAGHHGRLVIIFEEASGVMPHIYESTLGLMSGKDCRMLEIGNMTKRQGNFYENYIRAEKNPDDPKTHLIQKGAADHPNYKYRDFIRARGGKDIYQHALSAEWVDEMIERWGEDHPRVRIRVLGLPALQDTNYMIESHLVDASVEYNYQDESDDQEDPFEVLAEVIFSDVAGMGDNQTTIGNWQWGKHGHRVRIHYSLGHANHSDIADKMYGLPTREINNNVFFTCDTNGEGSGILEMLQERGVWEEFTRGFKSHEAPEVEVTNKNQELYDDLETECWARLRNMLRRSYNSIMRDTQARPAQRALRIDFPDSHDRYSDQIANELTMRSYFLDGRTVKLQPKKEYMEKTNGDSPDFAEGVVIGSRMVWIAQTELMVSEDEI